MTHSSGGSHDRAAPPPSDGATHSTPGERSGATLHAQQGRRWCNTELPPKQSCTCPHGAPQRVTHLGHSSTTRRRHRRAASSSSQRSARRNSGVNDGRRRGPRRESDTDSEFSWIYPWYRLDRTTLVNCQTVYRGARTSEDHRTGYVYVHTARLNKWSEVTIVACVLRALESAGRERVTYLPSRTVATALLPTMGVPQCAAAGDCVIRKRNRTAASCCAGVAGKSGMWQRVYGGTVATVWSDEIALYESRPTGERQQQQIVYRYSNGPLQAPPPAPDRDPHR